VARATNVKSATECDDTIVLDNDRCEGRRQFVKDLPVIEGRPGERHALQKHVSPTSCSGLLVDRSRREN
jgi:hypothetical protein